MNTPVSSGKVQQVQVPHQEIPQEFTERCNKGELGGVVLVFINAKNTTELDMKKKELLDFAKKMKKKYETKQPE